MSVERVDDHNISINGVIHHYDCYVKSIEANDKYAVVAVIPMGEGSFGLPAEDIENVIIYNDKGEKLWSVSLDFLNDKGSLQTYYDPFITVWVYEDGVAINSFSGVVYKIDFEKKKLNYLNQQMW